MNRKQTTEFMDIESVLLSIEQFLNGLSDLGVERIVAVESSSSAQVSFLTQADVVLATLQVTACSSGRAKYFTMDMYGSVREDTWFGGVRLLADKCRVTELDLVRRGSAIPEPGLRFTIDVGRSKYRVRLNCHFGNWFIKEVRACLIEGMDRNVSIARAPTTTPQNYLTIDREWTTRSVGTASFNSPDIRHNP